MKRTQLYLDEDLWSLLHAIARRRRGTVSDLVRNTLREKYGQDRSRRKEAFEGIVGLWERRKDMPGTEEYVRMLRRGSRLEEQAR